MLEYTFPVSGGGPGGDFYWQFVGGGAGPGDIELKAANGVTGINAVLPALPEMSLLLRQFAPGLYVAGSAYQGAIYSASCSSVVNGANAQAGIFSNKLATNESANVYVINGIGFEVNVRNNAVGNSARTSYDSTRESTLIEQGGFTKLRRVTDVNGLRIEDGTLTLRWAVQPDGIMRTNESTALTGNDNLPYLYWKINDETGALLGYLPIQLNPGTAHYNNPSITPGIGAGPGAVVTVVGNDYKGVITVITGGLPVSSDVVCQIDFVSPFVLEAVAVISPGNPIAASLSGAQNVYVKVAPGAGTTNFQILSNVNPLAGGQTYVWYYQVME